VPGANIGQEDIHCPNDLPDFIQSLQDNIKTVPVIPSKSLPPENTPQRVPGANIGQNDIDCLNDLREFHSVAPRHQNYTSVSFQIPSNPSPIPPPMQRNTTQ
jgi:hypothetical protein